MAQEQGLRGRRGRLPRADGRAARPGQGRRARQEGRPRRRDGVPRRWPTRSGKPVEFTGYREVVSEGSVRGLVAAGGVVDSAREGDEVELVLDRTPFYAEGGGQLADQGVIELENGARVEVRDVQTPITGLIVHTAKVLSGEVTPGRRAHVAGRHRATQVDLARPHRDPHGAQGVPRGARRDRHPGGLRERAGPVPLRLLRDRRGAGLGDGGRRGAGQRPRARRPRRARRDDEPGRGRAVGRDGAVRREVRRPGAGDLGRRLGARAVRRHPRGPLRPARRDQAAGRVVDRLRRTPGRGAGRRRRLPVPGARARAGRAALRGAQGAARGAARAGQRHRRAAARRREGARADPDRPAAGQRGPARGRRGRRRRGAS